MDNYIEILKQYWGFSSFRDLQGDIITSIAAGKDTLGLMPTGGGKSLTFQVPALAQEGVCLVVTPLIALMKDQVINLKKRGIKALAIYSGMTRDEINVALDNCIFGDYKLLYLSPERLSSELFVTKLRLMNVSFIAVDEAHCISQWGYDFRPSYLKIADVRALLPDVPVLALTATATPEVVNDIQDRLGFQKKNVFQKSFERKNLAYVVRYTEDKPKQLLNIIESVPGSGVVYVRNRKKCKELALFLSKNGVSSDFFHAGLSNGVKDKKQKAWMDGVCRVIVSTNAFGMGIDKSDVRFVVHMDAPDSPEAYFQEAGRGGRDGKKAYAIMLWSPGDKALLKRRVSTSFPELDVVKRVYEALGNFFQIAVGYGVDKVYDFDIYRFCAAYKINILTVFNSLKILQRAGYLEFAEEEDLPSRIHFSVHRDELYRYPISDDSVEECLQVLLRSYTGLFADYVIVNEDVLAKRMGVERQKVYQNLTTLARMRVLNYIPQKQTSVVCYTRSREDLKYLKFPKEVYLDRKNSFEKRINTIIDYCEKSHLCRSQMLLNFFGQKNTESCGVCDVCLDRKRKGVNVSAFDAVRGEVKTVLMKSPCCLDDLVGALSVKSELAIEVIRWLLDNGVIAEDEHRQLEWLLD